MKKILSVCLAGCALCAALAGCDGGETQSGTQIELKTVEEVLEQTPAEDLVGRNDIRQFTTPFYETQIQYNEGFLLREDGQGGTLPVKLMFPAAYVLEVRSNDLKTLYEYGKDYLVEDGQLVIPEGSAIVPVPDSEFFLSDAENAEWIYNANAGEDEGRAVTTDRFVLYPYRYVVTYIRTEQYSGKTAPSKGKQLTHFSQKIADKEDITMLYVGDSIGEGAGVSGEFLNLVEMTRSGIEARSESKVELSNCSVGGIDSLEFMNLINGLYDKINPGILDNAKQKLRLMEQKKGFADIVFIALGANDSAADRSADLFKLHIGFLIDYFRKANPDVSIVLVSSMEISNKIRKNREDDKRDLRLHDLGEYAKVLAELEQEYTNIALADVHTVQSSVLEKKYLEDVIADNLNHPTDYMSRLYAQTLLKTIF